MERVMRVGHEGDPVATKALRKDEATKMRQLWLFPSFIALFSLVYSIIVINHIYISIIYIASYST